MVEVHGLLRCKNCKRLWNRDFNAAVNILKIAMMHVQCGNKRPDYLCRTQAELDMLRAKYGMTSTDLAPTQAQVPCGLLPGLPRHHQQHGSHTNRRLRRMQP